MGRRVEMKLSINTPLLGLRGELKENLLSEILADLFATSSTLRPAQTMTWAYDLIKNGEIEINKDDAQFIIGLIKNNPTYVDLAKAQLIEAIEKLKD
jgi:hypothetical protein